MHQPQRNIGSTLSSGYRYSFNGMETDHEVSGHGNSYTTQFRQYDPRLGRWKSLDPLDFIFIDSSPYMGLDDNPIIVIDPSGESGIVKLRRKKIVVKSTIYYYGEQSSPAVAKQSAMNIEGNWNSPSGIQRVNGKDYHVEFKIKGKHVSENKAIRIANRNKSPKRNFVRVTDGSNWNYIARPIKSSAFGLGGNSGLFLSYEINNGTNTDAHEYGHGADWWEEGDFDNGRHDVFPIDQSQDVVATPGIMTPRGSHVVEDFGKATEDQCIWIIDESKRPPASQSDIDKIDINTYDLEMSGRSDMGSANNTLYNADGSTMSEHQRSRAGRKEKRQNERKERRDARKAKRRNDPKF